jgi:hypothetical protein
MNELLELAVAAHGGLDRWHSYRTVSLELSVGGALWHLKGQAGLFANATYEADTHAACDAQPLWRARPASPLHAAQAGSGNGCG